MTIPPTKPNRKAKALAAAATKPVAAETATATSGEKPGTPAGRPKVLAPAGGTLGGEELHFRRLPGGLEAWVWRRRGLQNRHAVFATRFGAMDARFETEGETHEVPDGTAHFLEHMAFDTGEGNALNLFSRLGIRVNAFTSHATTAYFFSGTDNFWPALRELTKLVVTSHLTPKGVEKEKRVIAQEVRMYEDSPESKVAENLLRALYVEHPVRRNIGGTVESVMGIRPETLLRCHRTFYHPSNLVFVAAGDLDPERVFEVVAATLEELGTPGPAAAPTAAPTFRRLFPNEPPLPGQSEVSVRRPVQRPSFLVGFKDPRPTSRPPVSPPTPSPPAPRPSASPSAPPPTQPSLALFRREIALNLLVDIVFGSTSPLYNDLYRDGLIDESFSARYVSDLTFGYAVAGGATRDAAQAAARLLEGISGRRPKGIAEPDLQRKRRKALGHFVGLADSLEGMATLFLTCRLKGIDLRSYPDILGAITLDEVNQAFAELFVPERASVSIIRPGPA